MKLSKKMIKNNLYMIKFMFKTNLVYCTLNMLFITFRDLTFGVFGSIFFIKYLVDSVTTALSEPSLTPEILKNLLTITCIYYTCVIISNTVVEGLLQYNYFRKKAALKVTKAMTLLISNKAVDVDLECYDNPEHYDKLMVSINESEKRAWEVYNNFVKLFDTICRSFAIFFVILAFDIFIFIIAVTMYILDVLLSIKKTKSAVKCMTKLYPITDR